MSDEPAAGHGGPEPVPSGDAKVAQAIADGLMVLPPDDGVPPLLRRRNHVAVDRSERPAPPAAPVFEESAQPPKTVVTPHPAVFRSRATPLARASHGGPSPRTKPAEPPALEKLEIEAPPEPAPETVPPPAHAAAGSPVMQEFARVFERPAAAPPSLEAIRSLFKFPESAPVQDTAPVCPANHAMPEPLAGHEAATQPAPPAGPIPDSQERTREIPVQHHGAHPYSHVPHGLPQYAHAPMPQPMHYPALHYAMPHPVPGWHGYPAPLAYSAPAPAYAVPQPIPQTMPQPMPYAPPPSPGAQLMQGLLQYLPPPGSVWPAEERIRWLEAASTLFDLAYGNAPGRNRQ